MMGFNSSSFLVIHKVWEVNETIFGYLHYTQNPIWWDNILLKLSILPGYEPESPWVVVACKQGVIYSVIFSVYINEGLQ